MTALSLVLALIGGDSNDPKIDKRTLFALFENYRGAFRDVTFLHEGTVTQVARTAGREPPPGPPHRFQALYAYRSSDGATLRDVFGLGQRNRPEGHIIYALLNDTMEVIDVTPNAALPPPRERVPVTAPGGAGSLNGPDSPERFLFNSYYSTLEDPAEHELESQGWEEIGGQRCLRVRMLRQPRRLLKGWVGGLPYVKLWIDVQRDACPLRYEYSRGDELEIRTEISALERMTLPSGRALWFPVAARTWTYRGQNDQGAVIYSREPVYQEDQHLLRDTVKFDQGLGDSFFSVKKHAQVASDEGLRKLQREVEKIPAPKPKKPPADPDSRQKRLDDALAEADSQAVRLQASSAARAGVGWLEALYAGLGAIGVGAIGGACFWYWRAR
jgi:hypothetical protein